MPEYKLTDVARLPFYRVLVETGLAPTDGDAQRLIEEGSVRIHRASSTLVTHVTRRAQTTCR